MLTKKVTIDLFTLLIWVALCYFGLSTYFMMKHTSQILSTNDQDDSMDIKKIIPCKDGHLWTNCPPCIPTIQKNTDAMSELQLKQTLQSCPECICRECDSVPCEPTIKEVIKVETAFTCRDYHRQFLRYGSQEQKCPFYATSYAEWGNMPPLCDYLNLECLSSNTLFGVAPKRGSEVDVVQRSWGDTIFLEHVLSAFPEYGNITEVGVRSGVSSLYLSTVAKLRGGSLTSFDKADWRLENVQKAWNPADNFIIEDILGSTPNLKFLEAISRENSIIIFDGDDRKQEILTYLPHMKPGTVFVGHDFGDTILTSWIEQDLSNNNAIEIFGELAEHLATFFRAFKKS